MGSIARTQSRNDEFSPRRPSYRQTVRRREKGRTMKKITPWLWFDTEAEEAARFYTSVFPSSRITEVTRYGAAGPRPEGTVMTVSFELDGQELVGLNGGPEYKFTEAFSLQVSCED